jgi:cysteine desulfurase/selenocysteine lyase
VANFLNSSSELIAFTSGATDSLNMVATMWGLENLADGDEVMLCNEDHASSVLPWYNVQELLSRRGVNIKIIPFAVHSTGTYDRKSFRAGLGPKTRIVCLSHIHHLYGMEMDIAELKTLVPEQVFVSLDASQSVSHIKVDAEALAVDFISFSAHKMFGCNGTGVLWSSPRAVAQMWPTRVGAKTTLSSGSGRFNVARDKLSQLVECGTLNLPGILSLKAAIEFIESNGIERMSDYISGLTIYLLEKLKSVEGIEFAPGIGVCDCTKGFGIISFRINGFDSADIGAYLDSEEIFVKTGDQCLGSGKTDDDLIRISLQIYNTAQEVDRFLEVLNEAISS